MAACDATDDGYAVETDVKVAGSGDFHAGDAFEFGEDRSEFTCKFCRYSARSFAEAFGELECNRKGKLA